MVIFFKKRDNFKSATMIMALQKRGHVWFKSNLIRTNFSMLKSNHGHLFENVGQGYDFWLVLTGHDDVQHLKDKEFNSLQRSIFF